MTALAYAVLSLIHIDKTPSGQSSNCAKDTVFQEILY